MRIDNSKQTKRVSLNRSRTRASTGGRGFELDSAPRSEAAGGARGPRPLAAVDALLAIQEVPDSLSGRARAVQRGGEMLDLLEDIRIAVLSGAVPENKLAALLRVVASKRGEVDDAALAGVLDEIELRARVELAKFGEAA